MKQIPFPDSHRLYSSGDTLTVTLEVESHLQGAAYFRTNLGCATLYRKEIVESVRTGRAERGLSWQDFKMRKISDQKFELKLSLLEVGHFEGKCLFFQNEAEAPVWAHGGNIQINVAPADNCAGNMVYCAFPRQFGRNKASLTTEEVPEYEPLTEQGYAVIPPSGTFRDLLKEVDFIFDELKCRILHLLPINPTPTVYGRMGVYGSPYAALDFTSVDPSLAEFDRYSTPLEQFCELCNAVHSKDGKVFIDLAINHTGWAAKIHEEHPEWLKREADGFIVSPGAWGTIWGDLTELDHHHKELWTYLADMFLTWCHRGVDGFRCDAGYMVPLPAWRYIIAKVRTQYPNTVFLLEGLGGDPKITEDMLNYGDMNWAYSELFQNYSKQEIINYTHYSHLISRSDGLMFNYAETHDNSRLAAVSQNYSKMRTGLAALLSVNGAFGFTNGVEWFATEKIDVHRDSGLNWGSEKNQVDYIGRINKLLICCSAFHANATFNFLESHDDSTLVFTRTSADKAHEVLVIINLDSENCRDAVFHPHHRRLSGSYKNLLSEKMITFFASSDTDITCSLAPGECVCVMLELGHEFCKMDEVCEKSLDLNPIRKQRSKFMALDCLRNLKNTIEIGDENVDELVALLLKDPKEFYQHLLGDQPLTLFDWTSERDLNRVALVPKNYGGLVSHSHKFRVKLKSGSHILCQYDSIESDNGNHFVIIPPLRKNLKEKYVSISLTSFTKGEGIVTHESKLLMLGWEEPEVSTFFSFDDIVKENPLFFAANEAGGICHLPVKWGEINSKYDGLLLANLSEDYPVDRQVMLSRTRCWIKHHGYSHELNFENMQSFERDELGQGIWDFKLPVGSGFMANIIVTIAMDPSCNRVLVKFERKLSGNDEELLGDLDEVELIIRPDIEDRNFHTDTKAMYGPEANWGYAVTNHENGFTFTPAPDRVLRLSMESATFHRADEWSYSNFHPVEASRGLEAYSDLFSPGYFKVRLVGGASSTLEGSVNVKTPPNAMILPKIEPGFEGLLKKAMLDFVVKRDDLKTVIAGYPWFLDWGRDTLICVRGLISTGDRETLNDVEGILHAFAKFEERGTLPNMIHGHDAANRETSDAPLWFFIATQDYCCQLGHRKFLDSKPPGCERTILEILVSIAENYILGTPNGIKVDEESGLVYSPSHFTWMDTNYPAGTPRAGYPIEIQSLWHGAINFLVEITADEKWKALAILVKESIIRYFVSDKHDFLSDCLHAHTFMPAKAALADDALRSNQLFAVTLGAVTEPELMKKIVHSSEELLIPGAIRSLADRPVEFALPVYAADGHQLNDAYHPFWGKYEGDEDTRRKPAYHNGTAWTWPFPSWSEAYFMLYGEAGKATAKAILSSSKELIKAGCVGHIPEIIDGAAPHYQRGCDAQAWGATELFRVWKLVK